MLKILNKKLNPDMFRKYVEELPWHFWNRKIDKLVFHHTSSPQEKWDGSKSMLHYYNLYASRGWEAGPHIFIEKNGIWLFTDMRKQGRHAKSGNKGSIGIEIVGKYDKEAPTDPDLCYNIAVVASVLMAKFNLTPKDTYQHVDFEKDTFCTNKITQFWLGNLIINLVKENENPIK